ncbi:unnamed protein product [Meganyctiphanes norvegica]|uniref:Major facilitator superfamily associated domain-containing protein n=1 Tax=Meganyctiphanes norvegica TaxID=48144 RepID=A0AAV2PJW9_MEGNR
MDFNQQQQQQGGYYEQPQQQDPYAQQQEPLQQPLQQGGAAPGMPALPPGARPYVDPEAMGEVDPTAYPDAKESTHKVRGKSDIMELLCNNVNQNLLMAKTFYFFFFSAFGSLFPLMAVYFKQMGMNAAQTGFLIGIRPFVEFIAAPFWGAMADRFQRGKTMLLAAVGSWILFTLSIGFVEPPATACIIYNKTRHAPVLLMPHANNMRKRSVNPADYYINDGQNMDFLPNFSHDQATTQESLPHLPHLYHKRSTNYDSSLDEELRQEGLIRVNENHPYPIIQRIKRSFIGNWLPPDYNIGQSPHGVSHAANYEDFKPQAEDWITPPFSSIVYERSDVNKVFFLLLLLVILGEFFSCPAITLADSAVLTYLADEDEQDHYGRQRMFGSLGWGLAMFFVGIALDHSTAFPDHPCGVPHDKERNYTICFAVFSVLMGCALITATQFKFDYTRPSNDVALEEVDKEPVDNGPKPWNEPKIPMAPAAKSAKEQFEEAKSQIKTKIYAQQMREMPDWMVVLREFANLRCGAFLFVAWWMGFGIGLIFAFLFWHLQDYGGTPTVFGIASIMNHISEIFAYFFSFRLISQIGHVKVLCLGLMGNVVRFLYISWIKNPWWVLPFEFIQGITHATVWAACCSYLAHNTPPHLRSNSQGVLQGIHHGFGRGTGAIFGGIFVSYFGTAGVFRMYGVFSLIILGGFMFIHFYKKDVGFQHDLPPEDDPREMAQEGTALAPHGVPANPIPRALSSSKLDGPAEQGYGTYNTSNGMLDAPGGGGSSNPFVSGGGGGGDGGGDIQIMI